MTSPKPATYAQVCAASVTSMQKKNEAQPSILASRLTQAHVSMSGGTVTEIKRREMDVVSPSDSSGVMNMPSLPSQPLSMTSRPSTYSSQSLLNQQRILDPFTVMLPGSGDHMSSTASEHSIGSTEYIDLNQDIVPKVRY